MEIIEGKNKEYYCPVFYPVSTFDGFYPAIVCFEKIGDQGKPDIRFFLVRLNCILKEQQDALIVSESDYKKAIKASEKEKTPEKKAQALIDSFKNSGYHPIEDFNNILDAYYPLRDEMMAMLDLVKVYKTQD